MPSKPITRVCETCGATFQAQSHAVKRGAGRYCSPQCFYATSDATTRVCEWCGNSFRNWSPRDGRFCSMTCYDGWRRDKLHPDRYIRVTGPDGQVVAEHRLVVEQHLGRPLRDDEFVHHINGDKQDNRLDNLQVVSHIEHMRLHRLETIGRWSRKFDRCVECDTTDSPHTGNGLCRRCWQRRSHQSRTGHVPFTWSRRHERCIECGTTDRPHLANGRCSKCHSRYQSRKRRGKL